MNTIDIQAKEWFHKEMGNSYFSALVTFNHLKEDEQSFTLPFQYGYDEQYIYEALSTLKNKGVINFTSLRDAAENNTVVNYSIKKDCTKKQVKDWGTN